MLVLLRFQYTTPFEKKSKTDYTSFGSTALDAVYGRMYNYDLILDKKEKTGSVNNNLINNVFSCTDCIQRNIGKLSGFTHKFFSHFNKFF